MLLADVSGKPAGSSSAATLAGGAVRMRCELTRNSTSENASQPATSASRPSARRLGVIRRQRRGPGGGLRGAEPAASRAATPRASARRRPAGVARQDAAPGAVAGVLRAFRPDVARRARPAPRRGARGAGGRRGRRAVAPSEPWSGAMGALYIGRMSGGASRRTAWEGRVAGGRRLLVCATPIGNLEDVTLRVLAALAAADVVACEDTRHTRVLLRRHGIAARELVSCHEHNERERAGELVARMRAGATVALVSDAGTPLISDPGLRAGARRGGGGRGGGGRCRARARRWRRWWPSGCAADRWRFGGFLPRRRAELERVLLGNPETLVAFESPRRLAKTLAALAERDPRRRVAVCRELTKLHEEVRRGGGGGAGGALREAPAARGGGGRRGRAAPRRGRRRGCGWWRYGSWWTRARTRGGRGRGGTADGDRRERAVPGASGGLDRRRGRSSVGRQTVRAQLDRATEGEDAARSGYTRMEAGRWPAIGDPKRQCRAVCEQCIENSSSV